MGPKQPRSTSLSPEEEAACLVFRRHTQLPLDDCLYALQDVIPYLSRSSLHRLFQRHGISRLPDPDPGASSRKRFKAYPIGYLHIDIAEVRTEQGKHHLFVAIDRTSKFVVARLETQANRRTAAAFLDHVIDVVPYRIHTVLTDNGIQFTDSARYRDPNKPLSRRSRFDQRCVAHAIEHRLTRPNHPWTNGQVERMNRTLKAATIKRYHYARFDELQGHLQTFLAAYNYAKKLKTLKGKTPFEFITAEWNRHPGPFHCQPNHLLAGLDTYIQDQLTWQRWHLTLGGREDYIKQDNLSYISGMRDERSDDAFSARTSILYASAMGLSPYFSYSEAFTPGSDATVDGATPPPVDSNQYEVGLKYQPPGSENLYTIALYNLTQKNETQRTAVTPIQFVPVDDIRSQGVELTANAAVTDKLHVIAGYSYNDIEYEDDGVFEKGNTPVLSPDQLASLWLEYDFPLNIRAGLGGRYVGESWANSANTVKVDDYAVADAFVGFDLGEFARRLAGTTLRINANNMFDKEYLTGCFNQTYCYFGDARSITATLDYQF